MLKVAEVFKSIQGETSYAGMLCSFIRLCGCNLRCSFCDTRYSYYGGKEASVGELIRQISKLNCNLVMVTGGEPLLQDDVYGLVSELSSRNYKVLIETNGSLPVGGLGRTAVRIVDLKCPDSGMCDKMNWTNMECLCGDDEVKFVVSSRKDYEWAKSIIAKYELDKKLTVLISPAWNRLKINELADWMISDSLNARLQLQIHKFIWQEGGHEGRFEKGCCAVERGH